MKRNMVFILLAACVMLILAGCTGATAEGKSSEPSTSAKAKEQETTFTGYLMDVKCGDLGKSRLDGTDLASHPEKHTLECALSPESVASGYGLCMKDEKGVYQFFPFDADGSRMAKAVLEKSIRKDNLLVELKYVKQDDMIHLVSITEIDQAPETTKAE